MNKFDVDPHLKFWEKIEDNVEFVLSFAPVSYFGHNLLLKIPIDSGLIIFFKGNSILYNFYINRENQISMFSRPKLRFKLLWKIMTFFEHFSVFLNFSWIISFSIFKFFSKEQIRCHNEFFIIIISLKKWNKMKSNQKSHLINFKLILVRTNQN